MELNKFIEHTLLKQDATIEEVKKLLDEAIEYNFLEFTFSVSMS